MAIPLFFGEVKNGKLELFKPDLFKMYYQSMEGLIGLTIRKKGKVRSIPQNSYYWGVVINILANELGYEVPDDMHYELRRMFLKESDKNGIVKSKSTTKLTTKEFEEYLEKIRIWAAKENIQIPLPNEIINT